MNFSESTYEDEFIMFMRSQEALLGLGEKSAPQIKGLSPQQQSAMMRLTKHRAFKDLVQKVKDSPVGSKFKDFPTLGFIDVDFLLHVVLHYPLNLIFQEFQSWLDSATPELDVVPVWNEDKSFSKETRPKKFCTLSVFCTFSIKPCPKDDTNCSYIAVLICL